MSITTEFCIFESAQVPTFSLNWQSYCFEQNLPKKGISGLKQKKWPTPLKSIGGCNPINWLSQTRGNLANEYLNLNFVTTPKLTPLHSIHFMRKRFLFVAFGSSRFVSAYSSKPFRYRYSAAYPFGFKVFNQTVENKKCFGWETPKEVDEGLGTGSWVTVTNLAPHPCGCGEILPGKSFLITCSVWRHV